MIIEFGLDGQNLCDPTAVFSKPTAWLLIHVLRFVSFAHCCIWKLLITLQACSIFLCYNFFFLPSYRWRCFAFFTFQSSVLSPSPQSRSTGDLGQSRYWSYLHGKNMREKSVNPAQSPRITTWCLLALCPSWFNLVHTTGKQRNGRVFVALTSGLSIIWIKAWFPKW